MMHTEVAVTVTVLATVRAVVERDWEVSPNQWPLEVSDPGLYKAFFLEPFTLFPQIQGDWRLVPRFLC